MVQQRRARPSHRATVRGDLALLPRTTVGASLSLLHMARLPLLPYPLPVCDAPGIRLPCAGFSLSLAVPAVPAALPSQCAAGSRLSANSLLHCSEMRPTAPSFHSVSGRWLQDAAPPHWLACRGAMLSCPAPDLWEINEAILQMSNTSISIF
ncbi:hypothetical protein COCCADRAFT_36563 [Bipolaris zeicola 26-R-13]|uniref:Uncharacterized protein n=1 Tax=Cochliobolus carbonum (strain 26-R-13) TaxID=930089 RepID=W6Y7Y1_COCC2|nr:uncharacterized protein COCCADRAFT_36563 [Bipolaris zeicola 26-R-13]EUC33615.1 hypothetical protein COCCADRAFT_36563 [Bipolaris zeicola 26-R-13]